MAHETGIHVRNNLQTEGICLNTNKGGEIQTNLPEFRLNWMVPVTSDGLQ